MRYEQPQELSKLLVFFKSTSNVDNLFIVGGNVKEMFKKISKHFELLEAAGGLVENQKGEILLIKRNGVWDLPKGKIDEGETKEIAALREVKEECGINSVEIVDSICKTYHTYTQNDHLILKKTSWFTMKFAGNEKLTPQIAEEITEAVWVKKQNLGGYLNSTYPSIRDVVKSAGYS